MIDCPVCGAPAEITRTWPERPPGSVTPVTRVLIRCVSYHWVAMNEAEVKP